MLEMKEVNSKDNLIIHGWYYFCFTVMADIIASCQMPDTYSYSTKALNTKITLYLFLLFLV
ncbi:hypothetical protein EIT49_13275 [Salmonella enterica]|nr:hypothetical protein [Salmonella enterica]